MLVKNKYYRTIWYNEGNEVVNIIDQRFLPFKFEIESISNENEMCLAIREMHLRGAGLIGVAAAWGLFLATKKSTQWQFIEAAAIRISNTRPTAVNLQNALDKMLNALQPIPEDQRREKALEIAQNISDEDALSCQQIGLNGLELFKDIARRKEGKPLNILTHCNAGWLAFVDFGSALAPIYAAQNEGIEVHVYVDETRPRNQGARLTTWELSNQNIPHTLIADNTGGLLMQKGLIDLVIVGADRVSRNGDVANKIGTYLKALAAKDNNVPFFVAFPSTTFDINLWNGAEIPIEQRSEDEILKILGWYQNKEIEVQLAPQSTSALNYGFDITPSRFVSAYITEKGVFNADDLARTLEE